ncbi:MAG: hypothetical protein DWI58_18510 [Chloroflexi bacterium]|nr:MAG: hypothetical protein DWI58_18510 [Chloroflexota bacterium]
MRDLIAAAARLPLWFRWAIVFFAIFMTATAVRGNLQANPAYTIGACAVAGVVFGVLAQIEKNLPGGRQKRRD